MMKDGGIRDLITAIPVDLQFTAPRDKRIAVMRGRAVNSTARGRVEASHRAPRRARRRLQAASGSLPPEALHAPLYRIMAAVTCMRFDRSGHLRRGIVHNGTCGLLARSFLGTAAVCERPCNAAQV
jgi:hypothetical protein